MSYTRTMAGLLASMNEPRDRQDYRAAIGARASRIIDRVMPALPVAHGFYDPNGFVRGTIYAARRSELYRETCVRLSQKALLRGWECPAPVYTTLTSIGAQA